jgi:lipopolysaccharide transport system ATP-binding protein
MSSNDIAIEVRKLAKIYNIYKRPQDRLKQSLVPRLQRMVGRPTMRYFREFWALRDVSFDVRKGETVGIIGRNGSGKSTLLQIVCGTLSATQGTVATQGRIAALLELGSGFNPQFTGRENVYLNGAILGLPKEEIDRRFDEIARFADIGEFIEQPVKMYSSGMTVRLAFAVQAMVDPDILIVDEALAVGDEKFQRKCFARLEELKSKGTAILFVSHSARQIIELCDKALLLENGERLMCAEPSQVVRAYQKLIYAPANEQPLLVQEYKRADKSGVANVASGLTRSAPNHSRALEDKAGTESPASLSDSFSQSQNPYFDAALVPETTVMYPNQGAQIHFFRIFDLEGQPVNVLLPGQNYQFEVVGEFLADRRNIYFGIHIRSISGTIVTGQRYPETGSLIEQVRAGDSFRITYGFRMILLPGVYFIGGGVWSSDEPNCLHRIIDASMFRIMGNQKSSSFGYVDASCMKPRLNIGAARIDVEQVEQKDPER